LGRVIDAQSGEQAFVKPRGGGTGKPIAILNTPHTHFMPELRHALNKAGLIFEKSFFLLYLYNIFLLK